MPLVTSHSRDSAAGKSPQISRPKSTGETKVRAERAAGNFTRESWGHRGVLSQKKMALLARKSEGLSCGDFSARNDVQTREIFAERPEINRLGKAGITACLLDSLQLLE